MTRIAYLNGSFMPLQDARISPLDRGFLFGDGIYEVAAVLDGRLVDSASHLARLQRSCGEIALSLPETLARIEELQNELVARNGVQQGLVYLQVTRGAAERDFAFPAAGTTPTLFMYIQARELIDTAAARNGIAVKTVPDLRWARRDIKSVSMLAQVLAKQAAAEAGCQEAWMVQDGLVTEGGSSTAFIVTTDGTVVTRANSHAILPGCTRRALLALADEGQVKIEERSFTVAEALTASEAFTTSASGFVQAVVRIDGMLIGQTQGKAQGQGQAAHAGKPGPVARRLRQLYIDFARGVGRS